MSRARVRPSEFVGPPIHLRNEHLLKRVSDGCKVCECCGEPWHWTGKQYGNSVPLMNVGRRMISVRSVVHLATGGEPADDAHVIVTECENPACMNPALVRLKTRKWLVQRIVDAGKIHTPVAAAKMATRRRGTGKLAGEEDAAAIRGAEPGALTELCKEKGISRQMAWRIRTGLSWRQFGANPWAGLGARS